jgi:signal peptidase I
MAMTSAADHAAQPGNETGGGQPAAGPSPAPRGRLPHPGRPARRRLALAETIVTVALVVLLAVGLRVFVLQTFSIPSSSMVPTLQVGDRILVLKAFFNWHDLHEGDIVVFTRPPRDHCGGPADDDLVKRVIALPGQTIYSSGSTVVVDGRPLVEPYLPRIDPLGPPIPGATRANPFHVPRGEFYVLGDNRADSCDSRFWGPVKGSSIVGRVVLLWWRHSHPDLHHL